MRAVNISIHRPFRPLFKRTVPISPAITDFLPGFAVPIAITGPKDRRSSEDLALNPASLDTFGRALRMFG
jgi:hypothetical protein